MKRILSYLIIPAIFIIFAFWILAVKNGFILRWLDEMSLFEPGTDSLQQFLHYPGGIFRFAGTYLTQLLYYPALGTCVLILIWLLCAWLTRVAFRLDGSTAPLCYLVPFCLLASILHFDEACLSFESQGYVFYNTIGFTFSIAVYCLFSILRFNSYLRPAIAILLPLLYPLAGFFALLPAVMCIISLSVDAKREKTVLPLVFAAISLILALVIPQLYFKYFTGTTVDNDYLYLKGLPELTMNGYDWYLWRPFVVASAILILFALFSSLTDFKKINSSKFMKWTAAALFLAGIVCCVNADRRKSEQFRATILMVNAIEDRDWNKITRIMSLAKETPNYTMSILNNLARAYCGRGVQSAKDDHPVVKDYRHDEEFTLTAFINVPVNHYIGRFNQSHHWATEHNVQYGFRAYFIKYVVLNAIMNGDMEFARKFNRLLMRTMFHRRWAQDMNRYIDNPSLIPTLPDYDFLMTLRSQEIMRGE